ncbi:sulfotransferase [Lyngbya aestuarii]|uniref:sulfotransferase n=1 Tax=Lyngbya aestuarii TaxID=118322 RepID=UPI00403D90CF
MATKYKPPVYIVGLPRSGTTWLASILNTAQGIKYFYEPFNKQHVPEAKSLWMKYLRADDDDQEFAKFCQDVFAGQINRRYVTRRLAQPYGMFGARLRWLPGRVMVKDVHSCLSLEWVDRHIAPITVIITRHPCAIVASQLRSLRLKNKFDPFQKLLAQPRVIDDYLKPFEHLLRNDEGLLQQMAVCWGAVYYIMLEQQKRHPNWLVVQHEELCRDPVREYQKLFDKLNLRWTEKTDKLLQISTTEDSGQTYVPQRISSQEPDKWKKELEQEQIEQVRRLVKPFEIPYYSDF